MSYDRWLRLRSASHPGIYLLRIFNPTVGIFQGFTVILRKFCDMKLKNM